MSTTLPWSFGFHKPCRVVGNHHAACIEGFPRSANTLAYRAFAAANPGVWVAHHVHRPLQLARAHERGIPCVTIAREPLGAVASLLVFDGRLRAGPALRWYIDFYRLALELHASVAICRFEEVIVRPMIVAEVLNDRFGTAFATDSAEGEDLTALLGRIERQQRQAGADESRISAPSSGRSSLVAAMRERVVAHPLHPVAVEVHARASAGTVRTTG